jgi:transposase
LLALIDALPALPGRRGRPRRRPDKVHADKAYDARANRAGLRARGIQPRIARRGVESAERLGRWRWVVERTISWLHRWRRLRIRYERRDDIHQAFLTLGAIMITWNFAQAGLC